MGQIRRIDGALGGDGVAFDAGDLHKAADGVARQAQMVLHGDLGSVFDLLNGELHQLAHRGGRHGAGRADLRLTAAFRAGDGRVAADQIADDARHTQRVGHAQVGIVVFAL